MSLFRKERLPDVDAVGTPTTASHTVMLVDDEEGNLRVLSWMLSERYNVVVAHDGREALDLLQAMSADSAPSVLLSDLRMPRMSGIELFVHVRELFPQTIRIILSGFVDVGATIEAVNRAGIDKFVVKPCDREELLATVEHAIAAFETRRQREQHVLALEAAAARHAEELAAEHAATQQALDAAARASLRDGLTGLETRQALRDALLADIAGQARPYALMLLDVDCFAAFNERHGEAMADRLLVALARCCEQVCAPGEHVARWGADQFALRVAADNPAQAILRATRLRQAVADVDAEGLVCTCSLGVGWVEAGDPEQADDAQALAAAALQLAKRRGGDALVCLRSSAPLDRGSRRLLRQTPDLLIDRGTVLVAGDPP